MDVKLGSVALRRNGLDDVWERGSATEV